MTSKSSKEDDEKVSKNKKVFLKWLIFTIQLILCFVITSPVIICALVLFLLIGISRLLVWIHIQIFHRGKRFIVSSTDSFWIHEEHANSSVVPLLIIMEGNCDVERIKDIHRNTCHGPLMKGKMLRRIITVLGVSVWENVENFCVDDHMRVVGGRVDGEENKKWTEQEIMDYMGTLQDITLSNKDSPPWELLILPKVTYGNDDKIPHYAVIFRVHHSIMDGVSSALVFSESFADKPFKFTVDPLGSKGKKKNWILEGILSILISTIAILNIPRAGVMKQLSHLDNKYNRWFLPGNSLKGPKHFLWSRPIKLEALKKIHKSYKTGLTTVLLSALGAGYRKALLYKTKEEGTPLPEFFHAASPAAMLPYPDKHPRNRYGIVVLPFCVGDHKNDAVSRLQANHKELMEMGLDKLDVFGSYFFVRMIGLLPDFLRKYAIGAFYCKMGLTNVPMSAEEITVFGGDPIKEFGAWKPCKYTLGLTVAIYSYAGKCRALLEADDAYVSKSDAEAMLRYYEEEVVALGRSIEMMEDDVLCK